MSIELSNGVVLPNPPSEFYEYQYWTIVYYYDHTWNEHHYRIDAVNIRPYYENNILCFEQTKSIYSIYNISENADWGNIYSYDYTTNIGIIGYDMVDAQLVGSNYDILIDGSNELYFKANIIISTTEPSTDKNKFLGIAGTERLIDNICNLIDDVLPSGGTIGQVLIIGEDGTPVWADAPSGGNLPAAEELMFG